VEKAYPSQKKEDNRDISKKTKTEKRVISKRSKSNMQNIDVNKDGEGEKKGGRYRQYLYPPTIRLKKSAKTGRGGRKWTAGVPYHPGTENGRDREKSNKSFARPIAIRNHSEKKKKTVAVKKNKQRETPEKRGFGSYGRGENVVSSCPRSQEKARDTGWVEERMEGFPPQNSIREQKVGQKQKGQSNSSRRPGAIKKGETPSRTTKRGFGAA